MSSPLESSFADESPSTPPEARTHLGLFAAAVALLLPTVYLPTLETPFWAPKMAIVVVLAAVGLPVLLAPAPTELRQATWAARAFLTCAALSTALSANPDLAVVGLWDQGTGLVLIAACVGAWAIGARLTRPDVSLIVSAFLVGLLINVVVVVIEMRFDLAAIGLSRFLGRAPGLLQSPVFVGPFIAGGLALLLRPLSDGKRWAYPFLAACGLALALSGGRGAALGALVAAGWALMRFGRKTAALLVALVLLGFAMAPLIDRPPDRRDRPITGTPLEPQAAAPGASESRRPLTPRFATWWSARRAVADSPLLGAGPGQFRAATITYRPESVSADTPGRYFTDAHNFVVEHAVTTGVLGLLALVTWLILASASASGPLAVFAAVIGFAHLFQPENVGTTPLALLALGAAAARSTGSREIPRPTVACSVALGLAATLLGAALLYSAAVLGDANLDLDLEKARRADIALRAWPQPASRRGLIHQSHWANGDRSSARPAIAALAEAANREPDNPQRWVLLAEVAASHKERALARAALRRALQLDPLFPRALDLNRRRQLLPEV